MNFKMDCFHTIHTKISELISNGYFAVFYHFDNLIISSPDASRSVLIEYDITMYLNVNDQMNQQLLRLAPSSSPIKLRANAVPCPTIMSAGFQGPRLVLSRLENNRCTTTKKIIYGFRCRLCPHFPDNCPSRIKYVGQTTTSVHDRVCLKYRSALKSMIEEGDFESDQLMCNHVGDHLKKGHILLDAKKRDVLRVMMDLVLLPTSTINNKTQLRSWELFWQFFCHARVCFGGWSKQ